MLDTTDLSLDEVVARSWRWCGLFPARADAGGGEPLGEVEHRDERLAGRAQLVAGVLQPGDAGRRGRGVPRARAQRMRDHAGQPLGALQERPRTPARRSAAARRRAASSCTSGPRRRRCHGRRGPGARLGHGARGADRLTHQDRRLGGDRLLAVLALAPGQHLVDDQHRDQQHQHPGGRRGGERMAPPPSREGWSTRSRIASAIVSSVTPIAANQSCQRSVTAAILKAFRVNAY